MPSAPRVSVVVPVRNGAAYLPVLFEGLEGQTLGEEEMEILIVDDGSADDSFDVAAAWAAAAPERRRAVRGPGRGPASARNAGIRLARGEWVASTDCDVRPAVNWLEAALEAAGRNGAHAVEGAIDVIPSETEGLYALTQLNPDGGRFMTGNMLYRRELLHRLGGFDETFEQNFLEDSDLAFRILDDGLDIPFAPEARVAHPTVELAPRDVLRGARRLVWLPLFARKHPERWHRQLRPHVRPLTGTDADVLLGLAALAAAPRAHGLVRATLLAVAARGLGRALSAGRAFEGPPEHRPARAAIALALPLAKTGWWLVGCARHRRLVW